MKIDNSGKPLNTAVTRADAKVGSHGVASGKEPAAAASDHVDINPFSSRLQALESSLAAQPVIDDNKVAEIKQAISEGRFSINADAIADKLMKSVKDLLGNKK